MTNTTPNINTTTKLLTTLTMLMALTGMAAAAAGSVSPDSTYIDAGDDASFTISDTDNPTGATVAFTSTSEAEVTVNAETFSGDGTKTTFTVSNAPLADTDGSGTIAADEVTATDTGSNTVSVTSVNPVTGEVTLDSPPSSGTNNVEITYDYYPESTTVDISGDTGTAAIPTATSDSDTVLQVADGDAVTAHYWDSSTSEQVYQTNTLTVDNSAPSAPAGVSATAVSGGDIEVSFDDVDETGGSGVASYSIKRADTSGGTYSQQGTISDENSGSYTFTDTSATDTNTYYYVVTAIDGVGNEGSQSTEKSATSDATAPSITGASITSSPSSGSIYKQGETVQVTVTYNEAVTVDDSSGTPTLDLGSNVAGDASYVSGSGSTGIVFEYNVQSGDVGSLTIGDITLNSGTMQDDAGNSASLTASSQSISGEVDGSVPQFSSSNTANQDEGTTGTVIDVNAGDDTTEDTSNTDVTYSLAATSGSGGDESSFSVDGTNGDLSLDSSLDYETPSDADTNNDYQLTVTATDDAGNTNTQDITVTINDVDESPTFTTAQLGSVSEDAANGEDVDNVDANVGGDADEGVSYALTTGGSAFNIDDSGQITVGDTSQIDYESSQSISITVAASEGSATNTKDFTIDVTDINEAPTGSDNTVTIDEDNDKVFSKSEFGFSDEDSGDSLQNVKISSIPSSGTLYVDSDTDGTIENSEEITSTGTTVSATEIENGEFKFKPATDENGDAYASFGFKVGDGSLYADTSTMTINVNAVNDAPTLESSTYNLDSIAEDATGNSGTTVSNILDGSTTDVDGDTIGVAVTGVSDKNGDWQYKKSGSTWNDLSSASYAVLLDESDYIRFVPDADYDGSDTGSVTGSVTIRAWDQTTGTSGDTGVDTSSTGGTTAFSSGTASTAVIVQDAPEVNSITRASGATNPTNADSVDFTVTFSESVSGVDTGDFSKQLGGDVTGTVSSVSGSGDTRTVTVNSISGDGDLGLDLADDDSITSDSNSVELGGVGSSGGDGDGSYTSGETFTVDNTASSLEGYTVTNPSSQDVRVTFNSSEQLSTVSTAVNLPGGGTATLSGFSSNSGDFSEDSYNDGSYNYTATYSGSTDGSYEVVLGTASDAAGNNGATSNSDTVTVDAVNPAASTDSDLPTSDLTGSYDVKTWFTFSQDYDIGTATYEYKPAGGSYTQLGSGSSASFDTTTVSDGEYTFRANVSDGQDNTDSVETGTLEIDNTLPSVSTSGAAPSNARGTVDITSWFTSSGDVDTKTYRYKASGDSSFTEIDGSNDSSFDTTTLSDGSVDFRLVAEDNEGNTNSATATTTVDNTAPTVQGIDTSLTNINQPTVTVSVKESTTSLLDATKVVVDDVDGEVINDTVSNLGSGASIDAVNNNITLNFVDLSQTLVDGEVNVTVTAQDAAGNAASPVKKSFTVDTGTPSVSSIEVVDRDRDGNVDAANVTFSEAVDDSSISPAQWTIREKSATSYDTGSTVDDAKLQVQLASDNQISGTAVQDVTTGTPDLTDLAGNTLGSFSSSDIVEEDGANPVIDLNKGLNLVSFPISSSENLMVGEVLDESKTDEVWKYVDGSWKVWTPSKADKSGFSFDVRAGEGYIVDSSSSYIHTPEIDEFSSVAPRQVDLVEGWNLVGHYDELGETASVALDNTIGSSNYNQIWENTGTGTINYADVNDEFGPGQAYWVQTKGDLSDGTVTYGVN